MALTILHTNDFHGTLTPALAERIRLHKSREDALYFDSGDCIKTGNLGIPFRRESAWELLQKAGCDAGVPGNRESHPMEGPFRKKIDGVKHPLLCANLREKSGVRPLPSSIVLNHQGVKIGVLGVMVAMVTERMATQSASAYLWDAPVLTAVEIAKSLRSSVDCLIALTHIGHRDDLKLAELCPELDLILGGHSHTVLEQPVIVGKTAVCQGGSHARYLGRYVWDPVQGLVEGGLIPLKTPK